MSAVLASKLRDLASWHAEMAVRHYRQPKASDFHGAASETLSAAATELSQSSDEQFCRCGDVLVEGRCVNESCLNGSSQGVDSAPLNINQLANGPSSW